MGRVSIRCSENDDKQLQVPRLRSSALGTTVATVRGEGLKRVRHCDRILSRYLIEFGCGEEKCAYAVDVAGRWLEFAGLSADGRDGA